MSKLSELLPAGAGAKSARFVATGNLASGQTVALSANGKVAAISSTGEPSSFSTAQVFESAQSDGTATAYDSTNDKIVIGYSDNGNSDYGTAIVGTVSGSTITFGTPVTFTSAAVAALQATFDSDTGQVVFAYRSGGVLLETILGVVSGTTITFGTAATLNGSATQDLAVTYDTTTSRIFYCYRDSNNSNYGSSKLGTVGGTNISFSPATVFESASISVVEIIFDPTTSQVVTIFRAANDYCYARMGLSLSSSINYGSRNTIEGQATSGNTDPMAVTYDSTAQRAVIFAQLSANGVSYGYVGQVTAAVGTTPGTCQRVGRQQLPSTYSSYFSAAYNSQANRVVVSRKGPGFDGNVNVGLVTGNSIFFTTSELIGVNINYISSAYDSASNRVAIAYRDDHNLKYGTARLFENAGPNQTSFVGITDQAIANTATGSVIMQGGVGAGVVAQPVGYEIGNPEVFDSSTTSEYESITFDSNSNKVVIAYKDEGNSGYGTAIIGTVSGLSITFGTPVVFESAGTNYVGATFDSTANKVVIAYTDLGNSGYGTAIVGTVAGTSISFGTPVTFESAGGTAYNSPTFDSTLNKVVIAYSDVSTSYGTGIVGTVAGTSISFGTPVTFHSGIARYVGAIFDSTANKVVIAYTDLSNGNVGKAVVGTVVATDISYGTAVVFQNSSVQMNLGSQLTFDSTNNKVVIGYTNYTNSGYGTAIVGTVAGTAISFGTASVFNSATTAYVSPTFDPTSNKVVSSYFSGGANGGKLISAIVSGTSISFEPALVFSSSAATFTKTVFDSNSNKVVIAYSDTGNSNAGTAIVTGGITDLVIGTDYYVEADGTLSTKANTVPAGRALSTSSILLEG